MNSDEALRWLEARPEITSLRAAVCDLNGILRGSVPVAQAGKVLEGRDADCPIHRLPRHLGRGRGGNPLVFQQGDIDGAAGRPAAASCR